MRFLRLGLSRANTRARRSRAYVMDTTAEEGLAAARTGLWWLLLLLSLDREWWWWGLLLCAGGRRRLWRRVGKSVLK